MDEARLIDARPVLVRGRARNLLLMLVVLGLVALVEAAWLGLIALVVFRVAHS